MSGFAPDYFRSPSTRVAAVALTIVVAAACAAPGASPPASAPRPQVRDIRSLSIVPSAKSVCPGQPITSTYVARLGDGSTVSLNRSELSLIVLSGLAAEPNDDGSWRTNRNPLVSAVDGFRLSAVLRSDSSVRADTVIAPSYGCVPATLGLSARDRDAADAYVRLGIFRTPFYDSIVVAVAEITNGGTNVFVLGPREMRSGALRINAEGRDGAPGRNGQPGVAGSQCEDGGLGEDGGDGGSGTAGGRVDIIVQTDAPWLADLVTVANTAGRGGQPGRGGQGGSAGAPARRADGSMCPTKSGRRGRDGRTGSPGAGGSRPRVTNVIVPLLWQGSPIWYGGESKRGLEQLVDYTAAHIKG